MLKPTGKVDPNVSDSKTRRRLRLYWTLYDFANSAYVLLIIAFAFPLFFKYVLAGNTTYSDLLWGLALGGSVIGAGLIAPFVGSYADVAARHQGVFRYVVCGAIIGTFTLAALGPGDLALGFVIFVLTNICFNISLALYDSYLRTVASTDIARTSGLAWGVGYLGGIACLGLVFPWVSSLGEQDLESFRIVFVITGVWYSIFSIPILISIPPLRQSADYRFEDGNRLRAVVSVVADTLRNRRTHGALLAFIVAYYFLSDATGTLTNFASIFARETLKFSTAQIGALLLMVQIVGVPATIVSGHIARRRGPKVVVIGGTIGWTVVCVWMSFATTSAEIYGAIVIMGLVVGSTYSAARTCLALLAPAGRTSQAFGLNAFSGRIAETVAPILFGAISTATSSQRLAVLSMLPFLLIGLLIMWHVRVPNLNENAAKI